MAEPVRLTLALNDDKTVLTLTLSRDGGAVASAAFNALELDELIAALGMHRAAMPQGHPDLGHLEGRGLGTVHDPSWGIATDSVTGGSLLALQHPGFGWLGFVLPPHEAAEIARVLEDQLRSDRSPVLKPH